MKQAKETAAQKSSHQNMRFWIRRARRTTVITPETMKKDKEASVAQEGQREGREMRLGDKRLRSTKVGVIMWKA